MQHQNTLWGLYPLRLKHNFLKTVIWIQSSNLQENKQNFILSSNNLLNHTWMNCLLITGMIVCNTTRFREHRGGNLKLILGKHFLILYTGNAFFLLHLFPPLLQQYQTKSHITLGHQCYKYGTVGKCHYLSSCFYWLGFYRYLCSGGWAMLTLWYTVILLIKRTKHALQCIHQGGIFQTNCAAIEAFRDFCRNNQKKKDTLSLSYFLTPNVFQILR